MKLKRPLQGGEVGGDVLAVQRALNAAPSQTVIDVSSLYDASTQKRMRAFRKAQSLSAGKHLDQACLDVLDAYMDAYGKLRYRVFRVPAQKPAWADIGPIVKGGPSVLDHDPTHATSGIPGFIAFDTAFAAGLQLIAPEDMVVDTKLTGASPGEAFYATGSVRWWIAHHDKRWPLGTKFRKGDPIGRVIPTDVGGGPHAHVALNCEKQLGKGRQLLYGKTGLGPDYSHGSPTIRAQLEAAEL
jgi:hypothetical protein